MSNEEHDVEHVEQEVNQETVETQSQPEQKEDLTLSLINQIRQQNAFIAQQQEVLNKMNSRFDEVESRRSNSRYESDEDDEPIQMTKKEMQKITAQISERAVQTVEEKNREKRKAELEAELNKPDNLKIVNEILSKDEGFREASNELFKANPTAALEAINKKVAAYKRSKTPPPRPLSGSSSAGGAVGNKPTTPVASKGYINGMSTPEERQAFIESAYNKFNGLT